MDLSAGTMVTANVRLTRPLGEGAMGCVWVADHLTLKTEVAVKFISAQVAGSDPQIMARFLQEASVAAQIKSPHVVQTFDQGVMGDGTPYIVMELLEGESLQEHLNRAGRLSLALAARILTQLSRALGRAHDIGVVHRDIKPDNIFLVPGDDGPFCKILDFGIAKQTALPAMGGLTSPGTMVGTPEYMSPEQVLSAKDVDLRADLWGLAVTVYHCITGELPFTAEALGQLCVKLLDGRFIPPSQIAPGIPPAIDEWMARALARQPVDRFTSAKEMASTFTRIVASTGPVDAELMLSATGTGGNLPALSGSGLVQQPGMGSGVAHPAMGSGAGYPPAAPMAGGVAQPAMGTGPGTSPGMGSAGMGSAVTASSTTGSLPGTVGGVTGPGTLTGSSSANRVEPKRMPWAMLVLGGAAAIAASVAAVVLVASSGHETAPAASPDSSAAIETSAAAEPASAEVEPTASATASAAAPEASATASASASATASASASATVAPPVTAPPPPRPPPPPSNKPIKPIFGREPPGGTKGKPGKYGF